MDGEGERQAAELEREIEETREQLDQTFDQLEARLSVDHLLGEIRGRLETVAHGAVDAVERHPTLVIAGAVGTAFLLHRRRRAQRDTADFLRLLEHRLDVAARRADHTAREASRTLSDYLADAIAGAGDRLDRTARQASRAVGEYGGDAIEQAGRSLRDGAQAVHDRGEEWLRYLAGTASDARQPLSYGLLGLALAVGIGLARRRVPRF